MNNTVTEAPSFKGTPYLQAKYLAFLTRQLWNLYFSNNNPTANDFDNIARCWNNIQEWFAALEFYGDKLIAETEKTENALWGDDSE